MAPAELKIADDEVLAAKRDLNLHGVGLVLLANGLLLALFWAMCYASLGGVRSAHPGSLSSMALDGYSVVAFACVGYILVMDMETALKDGPEAARRITVDWLLRGLLPVSLYILASAGALGLPFPEPRQAALAQGLLAAGLVFYGLALTRLHFHPRPLLLAAALLVLAQPARAEIPWRVDAPVPPGLRGDCKLVKLDPYFWDYLENADKPVRQGDWERLDDSRQQRVIRDYCDGAAQIHNVFVDTKVRLEGALRVVRSDRYTPAEKVSEIDRTLNETQGSSGMVEEKLGADSDHVMVLKDTRHVLAIERANLVARRGAEKVGDIQQTGSLKSVNAIETAGGDVAAQRQAGDTLFTGARRGASSVPSAAVSARGGDRPAGGTLRARGTRYDSEDTKEVPLPASSDEPGPATKSALKSIRTAFGHGEDPLEAQKAEAKKQKAAIMDQGYSSKESEYIQARKDGAFWGFGWWSEKNAKDMVQAARDNREYCSRNPTDCRKNDVACEQNPDWVGCEKIRLRKKFYGW